MAQALSSRISIVTHTRAIETVDPFRVFLALRDFLGKDKVGLLESISGPAHDVRNSFICFQPVFSVSVDHNKVSFTCGEDLQRRVCSHLESSGAIRRVEGQWTLPEKGLWKMLREIQSCFEISPAGNGHSFVFGFLGYFGYDTAWSIEKLPYRIADDNGQPAGIFTISQGFLEFSHAGETRLHVHQAAGWWDPLDESALLKAIEKAAQFEEDARVPDVPPPRQVARAIAHGEYLEKVEKALHYIRIWDIYQVQLGHPIRIQTGASPEVVYRRLRHRNPSPYMYMVPFGGLTLVGASPESFVRIEDGVITMRPIAGTVRRGKDEAENQALIAQLQADPKEVAEHVMLVDLCRNDIGRVCEPGSLAEEQLLIVERFSHVNHLVSMISGKRLPQYDTYDVIAATFPAGTMTGAPKVRAMEIIEELETSRRGVYAGAVGLIDFSGYVNMALCIRSATWSGQQFEIRASAGVVADSVPEKEWQETLHKMAVTYWAITGKELDYESFGR